MEEKKNFMQTLIDKFKESSIALIIALPAFFSVMTAQLFALFSENDSWSCIGADTAFFVFVFCYIGLPFILLFCLHCRYKTNNNDYLQHSIIWLLLIITILAIASLTGYKICNNYICRTDINRAFKHSQTMNQLNENLNEFANLDNTLQLKASLLNLKNEKFLTKEDSDSPRYIKMVKDYANESEILLWLYQNLTNSNFKFEYPDFCINIDQSWFHLHNFCSFIFNPYRCKSFEMLSCPTKLNKAKKIINYNSAYFDSEYIDKTPELHRFMLKIKELSYKQAEKQVQKEFADVFKLVQLWGVILFVLLIGIILYLYWRHLSKSGDLPKGETDSVSQYLIFCAVFVVYLLIPMIQPIEQDKIDVLKPYKSFLLQNWYIPGFVEEIIKETPEPATEQSVVNLKKLEKQLADLKEQLQNAEDSLHGEHRAIIDTMPDKVMVKKTNDTVADYLNASISSVNDSVKKNADDIKIDIGKAKTEIEKVKQNMKVE